MVGTVTNNDGFWHYVVAVHNQTTNFLYVDVRSEAVVIGNCPNHIAPLAAIWLGQLPITTASGIMWWRFTTKPPISFMWMACQWPRTCQRPVFPGIRNT